MTFLGDLADNIGTALNLPDLGYSEALSGNKASVNTGRVPFTNTNYLNTAASPSNAIVTNAYNASHPATASPTDQTGLTVNDIVNGTSTGGTTSPTVDPNAAAIANYNNLKQGIIDTSQTNANNLGGDLALSLSDTIHTLQNNQNKIDTSKVQADSSRIQGNRDILTMIGDGIQSGGVKLAQGNAGSSSAAQAIANAYTKLGQRQASSVGQQYSNTLNGIATQQADQNYNLQQAPAKFHQGIVDNVNTIVNDATQKIQYLQQAMTYANLPNSININQEIQAIRTNALAALQTYDQQLQQGVSGIAPASDDANATKANSLLAVGQAAPNLFQYSTRAPATVQNSGPVASSLPLFTFPASGKNQDQTV